MQLLHPQTLLPILLTLTPLTAASLETPELNLQNLPSHPLTENNVSPLEKHQVTVVTVLAPSQYPVSTTAGSLFTENGVTSATWKLFVQTFATTALGTWALGPTPGVGSIGLGDIQGTIGVVRNSKRAVETPAPEA